jgi:hypothetical protein
MLKVIEAQMRFGQIPIGDIVLDLKSRDDIPQLLGGLQHIYLDPSLRERVFNSLTELLPERVGGTGKVNPNTGRPGMVQWSILVLGVLRLGLNADYDRIQELANQHATVRQMLGHSDWANSDRYELQTLKDNLQLFTPEILDRINQEVVRAGHQLLKKNLDEGLNARGDSFVVETEVYFPTDTHLLYSEPKITRFGSSFAPGDKVIQMINNYDKDVFNGDIGKIDRMDLEEGRLFIDFDGRTVAYEFGELDELSLAYATSIHKAQGSEYPAVVIPLTTQHYLLLERNLVYTGVTRGKQLVVIIAQPKALAMAVRTQKSSRRLTNLPARLSGKAIMSRQMV